MSFLNLSKNIVRLRKEKKITQEALAEFAGVTKASVSKWETGTTTPDIQILPVLAAFFDISVDELLGYEAQLTTKQIQYYYHKLAHDFAEKDFDGVWAECLALIKKYYGCYRFLMQMAILCLNHCTLAKAEVTRAAILEQAETLCSRVIDNSDDRSLCGNADAIRSIIWLQQGKSEQMIASMEKEVLDINRVGDKNALLPLAYLSVGNLSMAEKVSQIGIYRHLMELVNACMYLLMSTQGDEVRCKEIISRADRLLDTFQLANLHPNVAAGYEYQVALKLCMLKADQEEVYERIERYIQMIIRLYRDGIKVHADSFFYRLDEWMEGLDLGTEGVRDGKVILSDCIASLHHPAFSVLEDRGRMEKCERILQGLVPAP